MGYIVGQLIHNKSDSSPQIKSIGSDWVSVLMKREVESTTFSEKALFYEVGKTLTPIELGQNYYLRFIIKNTSNERTLKVKLVNSKDGKKIDIDSKEQVLKTIVVPKNVTREYEVVFSPLADFNTILIENSHTNSGIAFLELSHLTNLSELSSKSFAKIGINGVPGTTFCINGEEIKIGKSGVYELKNGIINTSFFALIEKDIVEIPTSISIYEKPINKCRVEEETNREQFMYVLDYMQYSE